MANKSQESSSRKTKSYVEIERHWGDVPVIDAEKDLRVFVQPEDVRSAKAKDPGCCVFAQACKRQFKATKVLFWKSVAYVELPGPDGNNRVERFTISPDMRDLIENFDKGRSIKSLAGFELKKPRPSYTLDGKRNRTRLLRENPKRRSRNKSKKTLRRGKQGKGAYGKPAIVVDMRVRDGKGQVHFKNSPV